jgi:autotransporter-associated beta strand protein
MGDLSEPGGCITGTLGQGLGVTFEIGALNTDTTYAGSIGQNAGTANLLKVGTGTLTLTGANPYTGATTVSGGTLWVGGPLSPGSAMTVNDNAPLKVTAHGDTAASVSTGDLTLGSSGACRLGFVNLTSTTVAPLSVANVYVNSPVTIDISGTLAVGQLPLIQYRSTKSGAGALVLAPLPPGVALTGEWGVAFAPKLGAPFNKSLPVLMDLSKSESREVRYFSGSATYRKKVTLAAGSLPGRRTVLELGELHDIAQVRVNGNAAGVLWYPPSTADITDHLRAGDNDLEIVVTDNWANRLIGDEQEPRDFEVGNNVDFGAGSFGCQLKSYPDWFLKNQPRPSPGRKTFTTWLYFSKDSPLQPAGLVGPVRLVMEAEVQL